MDKLSLSELLDSVGINKSILAKLLDVSRQTIHRMGDNVTPEALAAIDEYKQSMTHEQSEAVPVPEATETKQVIVEAISEVWEVTHKNIALSRIKYGRKDWPIKDVAALFNLSIFAYNAEVQNTINHCVETGTSFEALRS